MNHADVLRAYLAWSELSPEQWRERKAAWERYVATRDGRPVVEREDKKRPPSHKDSAPTELDVRERAFDSGPPRRRFMQ